MWHLGRGTELLDPQELLGRVGVCSGWHVADAGCGSLGHFVFPAAQMVGAEGKVYAIDVQRPALKALEKTARNFQRWNVHPIWSDLERVGSTRIPQASLDLVVLANTLHTAQDRPSMLQEIMRLLRPGGSVMIVEWNKQETPLGPPLNDRLAFEDLQAYLSEHPIRWTDQFEAGDHHHAAVFQKEEGEITPTILSVSHISL
ncbi:class I SAM-dependent methyltransferase [Candidatus Uhrbacteria bacterium]|nr:class I SAM-dependent methyltransferase [Candidatus Uhrbacteria bacterium]